MKIHFCDFWSRGKFNPVEFYLYKVMATQFDIEITPDNPDIVFFSCFGNENVKYNGKAKKILFLGEHWINPAYASNMETYDIAFSHMQEEFENNYYFPLWAIFVNWFRQPQPINGVPNFLCDLDLLKGKNRNFKASGRKFCSLINNRDPSGNRKEVYDILTRRKSVDSYGSFMNNMKRNLGGMQDTKCKLLEEYKFSIAFENLRHEGYNTEKIIQPMEAGCIGVYWGGNKSFEYFNDDAYINIDNYNSMEEVVERMLEIDQDDELYEHMVNSKPFKKNPIEFHPETLIKWICERLSL
jgi:hypothetical protein